MINTLLYITTVFKNENEGIWKKISYNLLAYKKMGFQVDICYRTNEGYILERNFESENNEVIYLNEHHKDLVFFYLSRYILRKYNFVYIRKPFGGLSSIFLLKLFSTIKKNNNLTKIIMEIPTFPYANEIKSYKYKLSEFIFQIMKHTYLKYIDLIVYMGPFIKSIWNKPALKIENGIDINKVPVLRNKLLKIIDNSFVFIGVARLAYWHGYDRLINAIACYDGKFNIKFFIVGDGEPEFSNLKKIIKEKHLEDKIFLVGAKSGEELDLLYYKSHVCIDSLGRHRSGNSNNSSLKSKEYTAKGIPFIKSHIDDSFVNCPFLYNVSCDEQAINLDEIIMWYKKLSEDTPMIMRRYAELNLTWEIQCNKILSHVIS